MRIAHRYQFNELKRNHYYYRSEMESPIEDLSIHFVRGNITPHRNLSNNRSPDKFGCLELVTRRRKILFYASVDFIARSCRRRQYNPKWLKLEINGFVKGVSDLIQNVCKERNSDRFLYTYALYSLTKKRSSRQVCNVIAQQRKKG